MIELSSDKANSIECEEPSLDDVKENNCSSSDLDIVSHLANILELDTSSSLKDDAQESQKETLLKALRHYLEQRRDNNVVDEANNGPSVLIDLNNDQMDQESMEEDKDLPRNLIVSCLPDQLFSDLELKHQFESIFKQIDHRCKFSYFRVFRRCSIDFEEPIAALIARIELEGKPLLGHSNLKMFLNKPIKLKNSMPFLKPPKNEKSFLISPPSSPPVGWEQCIEDPPVVNYDLLAAISKLNPSNI